MPEIEKVYTFAEAIKMLQEPPAKEICDEIVDLSKKQRELYKKLKEVIPMDDRYTFGESYSGIIRPWPIED